MKKLLLFSLMLTFSFSIMAQNRANLTKAQLNQARTEVYEAKKAMSFESPFSAFEKYQPSTSARGLGYPETEIGKTVYDVFTNGSISNRFYQYEDGRMVYVWTYGIQNPAFPERGTGYVYYKDGAWSPAPTERLETVRTGWPAYTPVNNNGELIVAHTGTEGLIVLTRPEFGTGEWATQMITGPDTEVAKNLAWPRVCTSGANKNFVHVISANATDEQKKSELIYSRSKDGGQTWADQCIKFPDLAPYKKIGGDDYCMTSRGDNVAILVCCTFANDLVLLKSSDNGDTWTKTIIWKTPIPFDVDFADLITTDTLTSPDGAASIIFDNNNKIHVAFGMHRWMKENTGTTYANYPYYSAIIYWNETMQPFTNANLHEALDYDNLQDINVPAIPLDLNHDNTFPDFATLQVYRNGGSCSQPTLTQNSDGNIYLGWTSFNELLSAGSKMYNHVFGRALLVSQNRWHDTVVEITTGDLLESSECIYPQFYPTTNGAINMIYHTDGVPGLGCSNPVDHECGENKVVCLTIQPSNFVGVKDVTETEKQFTVSQNYPNPSKGSTNIKVNVKKAANVSVDVINLLGQKVISVNEGVVTGEKEIIINTSNLTSGIYFYNVKVGSKNISKKMIVE